MLLIFYPKTKTMMHSPEAEPTASPIRSSPGKDELNLAEFPIALLTDRVPKGQKTIEFKDQIHDHRKGQLITRQLIITASDKYGLPTAKDDEVILCLIQLTKEANNFTDRHVRFNRSDLIRLLGWPDKGQSFKRVALSLSRWLGVSLYYENAWWEKQQQAWTSRGFHIIESFEINDGRSLDGQMELLQSQFTWNEVVFHSFQAGYLKRLDLDIYLGLKHPTAKRLYRFLDKRFYHRRVWTFDLRELACEHVGISRTYSDNGKIKEKLQPAIDELTGIGFLAPMSREERYTRAGRGAWKITLVRQASKAATAEVKERPILLQSSPLEEELISRGVTPSTSAELVATFPAECIKAQIETFDWLVEKKDKRVSKSPGGYLADSIRKGYTAPKGFESRTDRTRRLEAEQEQRRKTDEAKRRAEAEQQACEEAEQARIQAYWDARSPAEQEALKAEALSQTNPFFQSQYRRNENNPELAERYLKMILDTHITALLEQQTSK